MKGTYMNNKKKSGCFRPFYCPVCSFSKENVEYIQVKGVSKLEKNNCSLSPEISMPRRFFKGKSVL